VVNAFLESAIDLPGTKAREQRDQKRADSQRQPRRQWLFRCVVHVILRALRC